MSLHTNRFVRENDVILAVSSLYWTSAATALVVGPLFGSTRLLTNQKFSVEYFLDLLEQYKVKITFTTPPQLAQLVASPTLPERDLKNLKFYFCSGSNFISIVNQIKPFIPKTVITLGYGMTEMPGFLVAFGMVKETDNNGMLVPNVELSIINEKGTHMGPGEQWEILIRSSIPFIGYYGNVEASNEMCNKEGWIHTGDIGLMKENGEVFVISREKEMLKHNDYKYSPSEIENVLMDIPEVAEICVYGLPDNLTPFK